MQIKYVTFEVSALCNMDCDFCFSYWRDQYAELNTQNVKECISYMKRQGLEAINFTGGEPLMRKDIAEIISFSKNLNLTTILTTNGILLEKKLAQISDNVDFIGLPLDSANEEIHNYLRPTKIVKNHHRLICELINKLNPKKLKINTIVTKQNADTVIGLGNLLEGKVVSWKLSQFIPGGYGSKHEEKFNIPVEQYRQIVEECKTTYPRINIITSEAHTGDDYCRIISSTGKLLKPVGNRLEDLGSLLTLSKQEMTKGFDEKGNEQFLRKAYFGEK